MGCRNFQKETRKYIEKNSEIAREKTIEKSGFIQTDTRSLSHKYSTKFGNKKTSTPPQKRFLKKLPKLKMEVISLKTEKVMMDTEVEVFLIS